MSKTSFGLLMSMSMLVWVAVAAVGCNSSGGSGGSGGSTGGGAGGSSSGGSDGGSTLCPPRPDLIVAAPSCNTVVNNAIPVGFTSTDAGAPTPTGGTIVDGLYESTRTEGYGTTAGAGRRITLVILNGGTRILWAGDVIAATTTSFRADTTISTSGTHINFTTDCVSTTPSPIPAVLDYTVSGSDLVLSLASSSSVTATTYTRRGCAP